ncbi:restriction endonuclease [Chromobacterium piscinae]|uniref:restriction endonuclease n=1 Tax=Chromobacterium piscinae TaxID=686831 RepID=UPI001E6240AC|nr:restriction endonuclease [Chromobacterium piscinae]MCD5327962.1 restriction endonuclease [Chromobacterium piscinae]
MKRRNRRSLYHYLVESPWWVSVSIAFGGACFFGVIAKHLHVPGYRINAISQAFDRALHASGLLNLIGLGVVLFAVLCALQAYRRQRQRALLFDRNRNLWKIKNLSWQQFELLIGEAYRRQGYTVCETGQGGADGGVDLILHKDKEMILVQCKQWQTTSVGAKIVREMFGLMHAHRASSVKIISTGRFTKQATAFAHDKPIELIGGEQLVSLLN